MKPFLGLGLAACLGVSVCAVCAGDWPQWRGTARDGHAAEDERLPDTLPPELKSLWKINIGGGFSSPVVLGNKVVILQGKADKEVASLLDAATGKELWTSPLGDLFEDEWGAGTRSTPMIDGDRVYAQACNGEFRCLELATGKVIWAASFEKDFGVKFGGRSANSGTATRRGNNGSGVIDGDQLFLPVGSSDGASLVAFNKLTGKILWKSHSEEAAYSSLMVGTLAGIKQVVYFAADSLMGIGAANGRELWRVPLMTNAKRHAGTPILLDDSVIVNSHTFGLRRYEIAKKGEVQEATLKWDNRQMKINVSTPVLVEGFVYSQGPQKDFVCINAETGETKWTQPGFSETVSVVIAIGKKLLVQTDRGELMLIAADSEKYRELGRAQVSGKTWNSPALANGRLYVREGLASNWKLTCFQLSENAN